MVESLQCSKCGTCDTPDCTWVEYLNNPVYEPSTQAYYQTVRYDHLGFTPYGPSSPYKMWYDYASTGGIAMATSPDGINWSFNSNMTGLKSTARHSRVLFSRDGFGTNTPYRIWYWNSPNPEIEGPEPQMIRTARSKDGVNWTNDTNITQDPCDPLLPFSIYIGSYGPSDILYFPHNSAVLDKTNPFNNRYVMYYDVTNVTSIEEIALAVSADGIFWARIGSQPVLPRGGPGTWDENYTGEHCVVLRLAPNNFKMWYSGGVNSNHEGIGCASSVDGINWTKFPENPVFSIYDGVAWRTARTYNPWVLVDPLLFSGQEDLVRYKFWMTGGNDINHPDIGYATQPVKNMSFQYYTLPQNTSGAADIPIFDTLTPLASLTITAGSGNNIATVRANIGWLAGTGTRILFKIWRGAPITGELVCSVQDGADVALDGVATTDFSQVVSGLVTGQPVTFVLTAETVGTRAQAVIGPLTFTAYGTNLNEVSYYELPNNTFGGANIPVAQTPVPVAVIEIDVESGQNVTLRSTACWILTNIHGSKVDVLFKLWRGAPITGSLIASADDSADAERGAVTSFSHVDTGFTSAQTVTYVLTAEAPDPGSTASIVGALIISGSVQPLSSFFMLPQNTSGSVSIPITAAGTPLAAITAETSPGLKLSLRAAVGWLLTSRIRMTSILFKIWRGAPNTGTLIYSALDSGEGGFDNSKVTALAHVDSGFTTSGPVTYTLTAELVNPRTSAYVIGPLTFTAVPDC